LNLLYGVDVVYVDADMIVRGIFCEIVSCVKLHYYRIAACEVPLEVAFTMPSHCLSLFCGTVLSEVKIKAKPSPPRVVSGVVLSTKVVLKEPIIE